MEKEFNLSLNEDPRTSLAMHPQKFALWLFVVSIIMLFAAFTSAYIVRQAQGEWLEFKLPSLFWTNSAILIISSLTMHIALMNAQKDNLNLMKLAVSLTAILGLAFLVGQWVAWSQLFEAGVYFGGTEANPAGSFLYVITGVHAFHLVTGVIFVLIVVYSAFTFKIHSKSMTRIEMCATYWHFLDILWLYLFGFLLLNQ